MKKSTLIPFVFLLLVLSSFTKKRTLVKQTEETIHKATTYFHSISTNGGYDGIYSIDLNKRYGEGFYEPAKTSEIWVQPPGTPSIGECYLRAYKITGKNQYLSAATDAALALAWGQRKIGGWEHLVDIGHFKKDSKKLSRKNGNCSLDDRMTQGPLSFLMDLDKVIDEQWLTESIEFGLHFMTKSQFKNGAWPQWYPLIGGYHDYYTFNDKAINSCISLMLKAHSIYGKEEYLESAKLGGDFIIHSQLPVPQSGWAQQYTPDLKPGWARSFEPPGVCSSVTSSNICTLADLYLYTKDEKYLKPIPDAISWLKNSKIGDNLWARLYEEGTNKPIYGDREDGFKIHYNYDSISEYERKSYSWQGNAGVRKAIEYYNKVISSGGDMNLMSNTKPTSTAQRKQKAEELTPKVSKVIASLDDKGRWLENNMIYSRLFVRNMNLLCEYLELIITINEH